MSIAAKIVEATGVATERVRRWRAPRTFGTAPQATRPICVLTVGRSGSSLAARALNLLGVSLGPEAELTPPSEQNPLGYWENTEMYRLNERILKAFGGNWYRPPQLPPGWVDDERVARELELARALVSRLAVPDGRWGFKDPQVVITLDLWRRVVGTMDYVVCLRGPGSFARSLHAYGLEDLDPRQTAQIWLDLNARALRETIGERRLLLFYEEWFVDPGATARRLGTFVHGGVDRGAVDEILGFFDPSLARAGTAREGGGGALAPALVALDEHVRLIAAGGDPHAPELREMQARVAEAIADSHRVGAWAGSAGPPVAPPAPS